MKFFAQKPSGKYKRFGALSALFLSVTASLTLFAGGVNAASLNSFSSVLQNTPIFSSEPALEKVSVKINGVSPSFTYAPFILGDYTLIPLRAVMENLGCKVEWVEKTQSILITSAGKNITLVIDSDEMTVNGVKKKIPAKAILVGEVTYVPLRAVSESLDATVGWDEKTQTAGIYSREKTHSLTLGICTVTIGRTYDSLRIADLFGLGRKRPFVACLCQSGRFSCDRFGRRHYLRVLYQYAGLFYLGGLAVRRGGSRRRQTV